MKARLLSSRSRAVGFAIVVSIIMLGAAALASAGAVVAPTSPSGTSSAPSTAPTSSAVTPSPTSATTRAAGQTLEAPTITSNPVVYQGQTSTLTMAIPSTGTPTYSWQWLYSANGEAYLAATASQCAESSGSGASAGATETCSFATTSSTPTGSYFFELQVTDSASTPETVTSPPSAAVTVNAALTAPATSIGDARGAFTFSPQVSTSPATVGSYAPSLAALPDRGSSSAPAPAPIAIVGLGPSRSPLPDSGDPALTAGAVTPTNPFIDSDQLPVTLAANPSGGTPPYSLQWYWDTVTGVVTNGDACGLGTSTALGTAPTQATGSEITGPGAYYYCYIVTDSGSNVASSPWDPVMVSLALTASAAPTITSNPIVDQGQTSILTAKIPSTGTPTYSWQWLYSTNAGSTYSPATSSQCAIPSGSSAAAGAIETCSFVTTGSTPTGSYIFEFQVMDSATTAETQTSAASPSVTVLSALATANPPTISTALIDRGQTPIAATDTLPATLGGSGTVTYTWLISFDSGSYATATTTQCATPSGTASNSETVNCVAGATLAVGTYTYEMQLKDSASTPVTTTSAPSGVVTVNTALTAPAAPTVSETALDVNQVLTVGGTIPSTGTSSYSWQWLISINSGGYSTATQCTVNNGAGALSSASETCTIAAGTLTVGSTYAFELKVTDSASGPETQTSLPSLTVTVYTTLATASAPTVSTALIDQGQTPTAATDTLPATLGGSGTVTYTWMVSFNLGAYAAATATQCATPSGTATSSATVNCVVGATVAVGSYTYEMQLKDSATTSVTTTSTASGIVTVNSPLVAGGVTPSGPTYDVSQAATLTSHPSLGTGSYTYQWYSSVSGTGACNAGTLIVSATSSSYSPSTASAGTTYYCYEVTDSATSPTSAGSAWDIVTVNTALATASAPTVSTALIDQGQTPIAATDTLPATLGGSGTVTYTWMVSFNLGAYAAATATQCVTPSGTASNSEVVNCVVGATVAVGSYTYEMQLKDSATTPVTTTSTASGAVTVSTALATASAPTVTTALIDQGQTPTAATDTLPATLGGSGTVTYTWMVSFSLGAYAAATATQCVTPSGTASNSEVVNCVVGATVAVGSYTYEIQLEDSASTPAITTSTASGAVTVNTALGTPGVPTVTTPIDAGQVETLTSSISTVTGTGSGAITYNLLSSTTSGGTYSAVSGATCTPSGSTVTCTYTASTAGTYYYKVTATDSATTPVTTTSSASSAVTVNAALTKPVKPTPSVTTLDADQALTVTGTIPSTGTPIYTWQWLISIDAGTYVDATQCAVTSGSGAAGGVTCSIPGNTLTASTTYNFELNVVDNASIPESTTSLPSSTVTTSSALTAGTPSPPSPIIDNGQAVTLTANPSGGSLDYTNYAWYSTTSVSTAGTTCGLSGWGSSVQSLPLSTYLASPASTTYYCYVVTDSNLDIATSAVDGVTVNTALTIPTVPMLSATALDVDQLLSVTGVIPSTGTPPYEYEWLYSTGESDILASMCDTPSDSGVGAGRVTCNIAGGTLSVGDIYTFELLVNDSATTPETVTSPASSAVTVSLALTAPAAPTVSAALLDVNQALTVTGTIPETGSPLYQYEWLLSTGGSYSLATVCDTPSGGSANAGTVTCSIPAASLAVENSYTFELLVNDSANVSETQTSPASSGVTVTSALTAPAVPTVSVTSLDLDQALTVAGTVPMTGASPYSWQWWVSVNGAGYAVATQCDVGRGDGASAHSTQTCSIAAGTLIAGDTYAFELSVTDSASTPEMLTSSASSTVTVSSTLTPPAAPAVSATVLDIDQALTVTATIPFTGTSPYSWQWLVSINGGTYAVAIQCAVNSGTGADPGSVACSVAASTLKMGDTYGFKLQVTDSAATSETQTSSASSVVTVSSALTAPVAPTLTAAKLDVNQVLAVAGVIPSTGTSPYAWQWLVSIDGAAYVAATQCTVNSGTGASGSETETCSVTAGTLTVGDTYAFELQVTDSASTVETLPSSASVTVTVSPALAAGTPTPPSPTIDSGQSITLTANPSGGASGYTYQWYSGTTANACTALGSPISGVASVTYAASPTTTTYYCYVVMDSATSPETQTSSPALAVTVNSALTAPAVPTVSTTSMNAGQVLVVTGGIPPTGTPTYSWQWLVSINGGAYVPATQCVVNSGAGASSGATVTCSITADPLTAGDTYAFELRVTDSSLSPETQTSAATPTVTVTKTSSSFPWFWIYLLIAIAVIVLASVIVLRRRRPPVAAAPPMQAWEEGPGPSTGEGPPAAAPAYLETPEDVGQAPPIIVPVMVSGPAPPPSPPPAPTEPGGAESDIAALMAELDKLSGEVQKKTQKPGTGGQGGEAAKNDNKSS